MAKTTKVTRWTSVLLLSTCLLLVGVTRYQAHELSTLKGRTQRAEATQTEVVAELQAELESLRVELAVRNVLDAHNINVPRSKLQKVARSIIEVAHRYDLGPELILGIIFTESRFRVSATSDKGAVGLMQLMPATAAALAEELELEWKGQELLTDPQINILLGSFYLRQLIHRYDRLEHALAAYNMGPGRLEELLARYPQPGSRYIEKVQGVTESLRKTYF